MAYPGQFHRLVIIGELYTDIFNTTLSIVPSGLGELGMPAVDDATLAGVASDVSAWWITTGTTDGLAMYNAAKLSSIKLNRIGPDGHYVDSVTKEHVYGSVIPGPIATGFNPAPQLSAVTSLRTAIERGRGSKGRMYLPPTQAVLPLAADGRISVEAATRQANAVKALINTLNARYTLIGRVGVASSAGTGRFEHVTRVAVGRTADTMRSRRNTIIEDYQEVTI